MLAHGKKQFKAFKGKADASECCGKTLTHNNLFFSPTPLHSPLSATLLNSRHSYADTYLALAGHLASHNSILPTTALLNIACHGAGENPDESNRFKRIEPKSLSPCHVKTDTDLSYLTELKGLRIRSRGTEIGPAEVPPNQLYTRESLDRSLQIHRTLEKVIGTPHPPSPQGQSVFYHIDPIGPFLSPKLMIPLIHSTTSNQDLITVVLGGIVGKGTALPTSFVPRSSHFPAGAYTCATVAEVVKAINQCIQNLSGNETDIIQGTITEKQVHQASLSGKLPLWDVHLLVRNENLHRVPFPILQHFNNFVVNPSTNQLATGVPTVTPLTDAKHNVRCKVHTTIVNRHALTSTNGVIGHSALTVLGGPSVWDHCSKSIRHFPTNHTPSSSTLSGRSSLQETLDTAESTVPLPLPHHPHQFPQPPPHTAEGGGETGTDATMTEAVNSKKPKLASTPDSVQTATSSMPPEMTPGEAAPSPSAQLAAVKIATLSLPPPNALVSGKTAFIPYPRNLDFNDLNEDTSIHSIAAALDESIMTFVDYLVAQKILPNRDAVPDHFHASLFDYVSREQRYLQSLMQLVTTSDYGNPEEWPTQVTPGPTALLGELAEEEGDTWQDVLAQVANQLK
eukprot:gene18448-24927_t